MQEVAQETTIVECRSCQLATGVHLEDAEHVVEVTATLGTTAQRRPVLDPDDLVAEASVVEGAEQSDLIGRKVSVFVSDQARPC